MAEISTNSSALKHFEFIKQIKLSGKRTTIDVLPIFISKNPTGDYFVDRIFETAVQESNKDTIHIPPKVRIYDLYKNTEKITSEDARNQLEEEILDLSTYHGREEARIRFKFLAALLSVQKTGASGKLSLKHATIIGWMKFPDGKVRDVYAFWHIEPGYTPRWYCKANETEFWREGRFFFKKPIWKRALNLL